jgi:membrane-associated phospholipid phosphatase
MGGDANDKSVSQNGPFLDFDLRISQNIYNIGQSSGMIKLLATIVTLSGDEAICYPVTSLVGFLLLYFSTSQEQEFAARRVLRIYGDFGAVCLFEQILKAIFKRSRPPYRKPNHFLCMPFEQYSFPSGHSLRAAYAAVIFSGPHGPFSGGDPTYTSASATACLCFYLWAACVALSRVILAKHFVLDVVLGAFIGVAVAVSPYPTVAPAGILRILLASTFTVEVLVIMFSKSLQQQIEGWMLLGGIVVVFWMTFPFAA